MKISSWLIQVYEMADLAAQQSAVSLLSDMRGLTVDARTCDRGSYVIVECSDATQALAMYELVMIADPHAELVHSTTSLAIRARIAATDDARAIPHGDLLDA